MDQKQQGNSLLKRLGERLSVAIVQMSRLDDEPVNIYGNEFSKTIEKLKNLNKKIDAARARVRSFRYLDTLDSRKPLIKGASTKSSDISKALGRPDNLIRQRIEES